MWLWIAIAMASYLALAIVVMGIVRSARVVERQERAAFDRWAAERRRGIVDHPAPHGDDHPKAA